MRRLILYLFFLFTIASCNNSRQEENFEKIPAEDSVNKPDEILVMTANMFFNDKTYNMAIPYYDSLILKYPQKGSFFYKRGVCKSKVHDAPSAISDYFKSIELNYSKKEFAFYGIGVVHHFKGLFDSPTEEQVIAAFDSAIYYYNECLKIDPKLKEAIKAKNEVTNNLILIRQGVWPSNK